MKVFSDNSAACPRSLRLHTSAVGASLFVRRLPVRLLPPPQKAAFLGLLGALLPIPKKMLLLSLPFRCIARRVMGMSAGCNPFHARCLRPSVSLR